MRGANGDPPCVHALNSYSLSPVITARTRSPSLISFSLGAMNFPVSWIATQYSFPSPDFTCVPKGPGVYRWRMDRRPEKPDVYIGMSEDCLRKRLHYYIVPNSKSTNLRVSSWLRCALRHQWAVHLDVLDAPLNSSSSRPAILEAEAIIFHKAEGKFTVRSENLALMKCFPECKADSPAQRTGCYMYRAPNA